MYVLCSTRVQNIYFKKNLLDHLHSARSLRIKWQGVKDLRFSVFEHTVTGIDMRSKIKRKEQTAFQDWATAICLWSNTKKQHVQCPLEAFGTAIPFIFSACYFCDVQHTVSTNMYNQYYCCPQDTDVLDFSHFVNPLRRHFPLWRWKEMCRNWLCNKFGFEIKSTLPD